ncbi:glycosyltransferase family 2 protein [Sporolactobacillus kofuensis]|uniref:Glycosyltransferase family 2 protein n=1 Tax=Sporolactobacillus kofuensis TaxID=269672 RepID=A0ABW1WH00_9BACL|nr:glycosyltransferase family 2 protein [Sporolactobacillus kofuensis]MCO7177112.1 glycosyltransferase [Sporolactobacillus kofuensis]
MVDVSIIIPVYNSEKLISRCLESIIIQKDWPSIEIIIVNDGSTDQTLDIVTQYAQKYKFIKVINQDNQKQSAARNNGLKHALGNYILFLDSDDYIEDKMIATMYERMNREHSDLCICGIKKVFNDRVEYETQSCIESSANILKDFLIHHQEMDVGLWNKLFVRKIIQKNELYFENGNFFEDTLFVFKYLCCLENGISFVETPFYNLMKRESSTTTAYNSDIEKYANLLSIKIREYLSEKMLFELIPYVNVLDARSKIHIIHHNMKFNRNNKKEKVKQLLKDVKIRTLPDLSFKYKVALFLMKTIPMLYEKVYLKKKNI